MLKFIHGKAPPLKRTFHHIAAVCLLLCAELQAEPDCITLILVKVKHKTDALGKPDMWCMKQIQKEKERRESGAGCGDLELSERRGLITAAAAILHSAGNLHSLE